MPLDGPPTRVTVILPAKNAGRWLAESISSIRRQTFRSFELVVVVERDSKDDTADIVDFHARADSRIRAIHNKGHGLVAALRTGLDATASPLIARMDADDIAHPERLARQVAFLEANPNVALIGTQVQPIDTRGQPVGKQTRFPTEPVELAAALVSRGCTIRHPTVLMRRSALDAVGSYRSGAEHAEDYDLWLRLSEHFELANLPDVLLDYRVHADQSSFGLNWRHRFARDCALIAAHARRRGESDPLDMLATSLDLDDPTLDSRTDITPEMRQLLLAYWDARSVTGSGPTLRPEQANRLIAAARGRHFGEGRKVRGSILALAARRALRDRQYADAFRCLVSTCEILHLKALPALAASSLR